MKQINKALIIVACCTILSTNTKQIGKKTEPITQPQPAPMPQPKTIFDTMPTYEQILSLLENKKPELSDRLTLENIKNEARYKIDLIQKNEHDLRAKRYDIRQASDMKTYRNILSALEQRPALSKDDQILVQIKHAAEQQMEQLEKEHQIQPKGYYQILNQLKKMQPTYKDENALRDIKDEVEKQIAIFKVSPINL
jgi:hypothetical protein